MPRGGGAGQRSLLCAREDLTFSVSVYQCQYVETKSTHSREGRNKAGIYYAPIICLTPTLVHVHKLFI